MKFLLIVATLAFLFGCKAINPEGTIAEAWSTAQKNPNFPYSEIERVYDSVLSKITDNYFKDIPNLDKQHTQILREYIRKAVPKEDFVKQMIRDDAVVLFKNAKESKKYRDTKEFQKAFDVTVSVSIAMAHMMMSGARDVYVAEFVEKNPVKVELFGLVEKDYQREFISWVYGEVTVEEAKKEVGSFQFLNGDRIYGFCSPPATWENLCGRLGFIIVREGRIFDVIVTEMN